MVEYIDKEDALRAVIMTAAKYRTDVRMVAEVLHGIKNTPPSDVHPMRHGYWIRDNDPVWAGRCSRCGCCTPDRRYKFCQACGAVMDGEWG